MQSRQKIHRCNILEFRIGDVEFKVMVIYIFYQSKKFMPTLTRFGILITSHKSMHHKSYTLCISASSHFNDTSKSILYSPLTIFKTHAIEER